MRACSNCRSEETELLDQGLITRLVSAIGGDPMLRAWVCRLCRHVDFWIDEPATEAGYVTLVTAADAEREEELADAPTPIPALG